jgi:pimeloyl-ACP methyl ester carboxylesterase
LITNGSKSPVFTMFAERCRVEYLSQSPHPERWSRLVRNLSAMWRREPNFGKRDLGAIAVPTAISVGEYDEIIKRDHAEQMSSAIPGARLVLQRGVSHFAMLQNPAQFNAALAEFLDAGG